MFSRESVYVALKFAYIVAFPVRVTLVEAAIGSSNVALLASCVHPAKLQFLPEVEGVAVIGIFVFNGSAIDDPDGETVPQLEKGRACVVRKHPSSKFAVTVASPFSVTVVDGLFGSPKVAFPESAVQLLKK
jgi:hypothetical protein